MSIVRTFTRIPRTWKVVNTYATLNSTGNIYYHSKCYLRKKIVQKNFQYPMGWKKKRKTVNPFWRPISTESSSHEESLGGDLMSQSSNVANAEQDEHENQVLSIRRATSGSTFSASCDQAEGSVADLTSTCQEGQNDTENTFVDSATTSAFQKSCEVGDAEMLSMVSEDKHAVSFEVGASVMRFIRGKDGSIQRGIEKDIGVNLVFPSSKKEDSIVIEGKSLHVIAKASEKIKAIIDEAVKSPAYQYSHFVSLPLAIHPELVNKLVQFQCTILGSGDTENTDLTMDEVSSEADEVKNDQLEKAPDVAVKLNVEGDTNHVSVAMNVPLVSYAPKTTKSTLSDLGIDKSIFIKPKTFHLTILMLKLWNKERVRAAIDVLQNISSEVIEVLDNRPLVVKLKGLDCMRGSRSKAHVLFAPIEEINNEDRLSRACQLIIDAYVKAGLVLEKDIGQKLKLHATVMNTTHRKTRNRKGKHRSQPFDARGIFEQFGSEHWGDYPIREAHLSQRFLYDENGYYHCCASIPFPENASSSS